MTVTARLVDTDGVELIRFGPTEAVILNRLELGYPDVRDATTPIPGRDGEYDTTAYHGASAITADLTIRDNDVTHRDVWLDRLRGYVAPNRRAYLHITKDGWTTERRTLVRGVQAPVVFDRPGWLQVSVGWRAPEGVYESTTLKSQTLFPTSGAEGGAALPYTFPLTLDPGFVPGAAAVTNAGTVTALPYIDIYGFCTNPIIKLLDTGQQIAFTGLTIQAGDFLRVDLKERVALLSNQPGQSRYSLLDFTSLSWWGLPPGTSDVAFVPGNPGNSCQAILFWRDTTI